MCALRGRRAFTRLLELRLVLPTVATKFCADHREEQREAQDGTKCWTIFPVGVVRRPYLHGRFPQ
jgi:hypothetical protein